MALRGAGLAFLAIDVHPFKGVTDTYGRDVDDQVLTGIVLLVCEVGCGSEPAVRMRGVELLLVVHEHEVARALAMAEHVRAAVELQVFGEVGGMPMPAAVSACIARLDMPGTGTATLRASDEAVPRSRHGGRNCVTLASASAPECEAPRAEQAG